MTKYPNHILIVLRFRLDVEAITEPAEYDAVLQALLDADYYGVDDLTALVKEHVESSAAGEEACGEDDAERASAPAAEDVAAAP